MFEKVRNIFFSGQELGERLVRPFQRFAEKEASSSILLLAATIVALIWANSPYHGSYESLWHTVVTFSIGQYEISKTLHHWINDGLMAFFFFIVGLEIKQELLVGELSSFRKVLLPASAALGGMIIPSMIFVVINRNHAAAAGWGIPMATDIAFALGALSVLGRGLPIGLRAFLSAFAIVDDIGAVLVIALFYTRTIFWNYLVVGLIFVLGLAFANFLWVRNVIVYSLLGIGLWLAVLGSGVHATVAGIVVAAFIPAKGKYDTDGFIGEVSSLMQEFQCEPTGCGRSILLNERHLNAVQSIEMAAHHAETPLQRFEHSLHPWVAFVIVPLFALANAGINLFGSQIEWHPLSELSIGIILGLLMGKPAGIVLCSYIVVKTGLASLPRGVRWPHIIGTGMLGGIGFTMSLFIMGLSFDRDMLITESKFGILMGSLLSAVAGLVFLKIVSRRKD